MVHNTKLKNNSRQLERNDSITLPLIIAFCIPVLLYVQTIAFELTQFDDKTIIIGNRSFLSHWGNVFQALLKDAFLLEKGSFYRPLQTISFMIDMQISGEKMWMFHCSNILIFGLISCFLFLVLRSIAIPTRLALFGTIIYCVHPLFISSVAWIPARGDLLLTLFSLLSFYSLLLYIQQNKERLLVFHCLTFVF